MYESDPMSEPGSKNELDSRCELDSGSELGSKNESGSGPGGLIKIKSFYFVLRSNRNIWDIFYSG